MATGGVRGRGACVAEGGMHGEGGVCGAGGEGVCGKGRVMCGKKGCAW